MRRELVHLLSLRRRTDIEEAAQPADRVPALSARPGRVNQESCFDLERPRDPTHTAVVGVFDSILRQFGLRDSFHPDAFLRPREGAT